MGSTNSIRGVIFDVGETIVDETRAWAEWADWLGVPHLTLMAAIGAVIARGEPHRRAFEMVRPGVDVDAEVARRRAAGSIYHFGRADLYPDAIPCLQTLRAAGYRLGVGGNQPLDAELVLRELGLPVDVVATSAGLGVEKPSPEFFLQFARLLELSPGEIAYVGDRVDNDVRPAAAAGMVAVLLRRGPWAIIQSSPGEQSGAAIELDSLADLPRRLAQMRNGSSLGTG